MSDSITFKYTLTEEDYVRAMWGYLYYQRGWRTLFVFIGLGVCLIAVLAVFNTTYFGRLSYRAAIVVGGIVVFAVVLWWRMEVFQRKVARKSPFFGTECEVTFSPEGMTSSNPLGSAEARWSVYTEACESAEYILLCSGISLYYPFPKKVFDNPEDLDRFRELIRANISSARLLS